MDCACNCHNNMTNGSPNGCQFCAENHASSGEDLKALAERLVNEAREALKPTGVAIVMVGDLSGRNYVAWGGPPMCVVGLKALCDGLIEDKFRNKPS
jgi:hypothetical protein